MSKLLTASNQESADIQRKMKAISARVAAGTPRTKEEVVDDAARRELEKKKWKWLRAEAHGPAVNILTVHVDTGQVKADTISRRDALERAQAIIGAGDHWEDIWNQLVTAANEAKKNEQRARRQYPGGYPSRSLELLRAQMTDETDRLKQKKAFAFKH